MTTMDRPIDKPVVSICCITYNQAKYISDCINGFLMQQTDFPIEIIIHDDCSSDETTHIIRQYAKKHPDLIFPIYETENQFSKGVRGMFAKYCIPRARGKYVAYCEGDDYWTDPHKLQKQVDILEAHPEVTMVYTLFSMVDPDNRPVKDGYDEPIKRMYASGDLFHKFIHRNFPLTCTVMLRREIALGDPAITPPHKYDYSLFMEAALKGNLYFLNEYTAAYRRNPAGMVMSQSPLLTKWAAATQLYFMELYLSGSRYQRKDRSAHGNILHNIVLRAIQPNITQSGDYRRLLLRHPSLWPYASYRMARHAVRTLLRHGRPMGR